MIVKTIVHGLAAAAVIAAAGLAWAEVAAPPGPAAAARPDDRQADRVTGGGDTGYLPAPLGWGNDDDEDDERHERDEHGEDDDD